jgi:hypothetical protein
VLDTPSRLMADLARYHQDDLVRETTSAAAPHQRLRPVGKVRWWTGRVIIRTGEAIGGFSITAHSGTGVADEHIAIS